MDLVNSFTTSELTFVSSNIFIFIFFLTDSPQFQGVADVSVSSWHSHTRLEHLLFVRQKFHPYHHLMLLCVSLSLVCQYSWMRTSRQATWALEICWAQIWSTISLSCKINWNTLSWGSCTLSPLIRDNNLKRFQFSNSHWPSNILVLGQLLCFH